MSDTPKAIRIHVLKKLARLMGDLEGEKIKGKRKQVAPGHDASPHEGPSPEEKQEEEVDLESPDQDDDEEGWEELIERG